MATYTDIPDEVLEPGKPIRSIDILALRDNIEFYAENNGTTSIFTAPGTWTKPPDVKRIKVTVIGGGGGGGNKPSPESTSFCTGGGGAGGAIAFIPAASIPGPVTVTVGAGGAATAAGGTSSFGTFATATGGAGGRSAPSPGLNVDGGVGTTAFGLAISGSLSGRREPLLTNQSGGGQGAILGVLSQSVERGPPNLGSDGLPATGFGNGGNAASGSSNAPAKTGGTGSPGLVIVEEFY